MLARRNGDSRNIKGRIVDKSCCMTIYTGPSLTIIKPDITPGLPEREQTWPYILQMASEETAPVLKEVLVELTFVVVPSENLCVYC
jgi:hypothetical protein